MEATVMAIVHRRHKLNSGQRTSKEYARLQSKARESKKSLEEQVKRYNTICQLGQLQNRETADVDLLIRVGEGKMRCIVDEENSSESTNDGVNQSDVPVFPWLLENRDDKDSMLDIFTISKLYVNYQRLIEEEAILEAELKSAINYYKEQILSIHSLVESLQSFVHSDSTQRWDCSGKYHIDIEYAPLFHLYTQGLISILRKKKAWAIWQSEKCTKYLESAGGQLSFDVISDDTFITSL